MTICRDCVHFASGDSRRVGTCALVLPPWVAGSRSSFTDRSVLACDSCDMGQVSTEMTEMDYEAAYGWGGQDWNA